MTQDAPIRFLVEENDSNRRVDQLVAARFPQAGRRRIAELFDAGHVRINGRVAKKGDSAPQGAEISIAQPPQTRATPIVPVDQDITELYSDDSLVALNKPAGIPCQPLRSDERGTIANVILARYPQCAAIGTDHREAGLVHRLDIGTSGVLVAALTQTTWMRMREMFAARAITKYYMALVHGHANNGENHASIVHKGSRMAIARSSADKSLPAATYWHVAKHLRTTTLLQCKMTTGRMHQIRIHLADAGFPIVGDELYGGPAMKPTGHFLHASRITFAHPISGQPLTIDAPLPIERQRLLDAETDK